MLKERHRFRAPIHTPRRRSNIVPLENVGIVPGNRFILQPLKKVSTVVRRHRWCRSGSATSTKTCIVQKATVLSQPAVVSAGEVNKRVLRPGVNRSARSLKRRHPAVVKTCLSPVSEQDQEDISFVVRDYWSPENRKPVGQFECSKRVEKEWLLKVQANLGQSPSSLRKKDVHHKLGEGELSLKGHQENRLRLGVVRNTISYASSGNREGMIESLRDRKTLSQQLEQAKAYEKGLGLGAWQRELHTRIVRQLSGEDSALVITKKQSLNSLVDEVQKRIAEARFTDNHAALKQETTLKGAHHQRRSNKRLQKVGLRMHTLGRNRVSPSSGSVGHKLAFQVRSVGQQQFVLPSPISEISANRRSERVRSSNEDFHGISYADHVRPEQNFLKGFLCSCTSSDDLPIGPLFTHLKRSC